MPWELSQADIEAHAAWMLAREYSPSTVFCAIGVFANFYRWCAEHAVDPECPSTFNPAAGAPRPEVRRYDRARLLSRAEAHALLGIFQRDESPLGRRDYAFFLARLRLGVPSHCLRRLRWGQIEHDAAGAWLRCGPQAARVSLPPEVWDAIRLSLAASARLAGMKPESYVFAPLSDPFQLVPHDTPQAWAEGRCQTTRGILNSLKRYGQRAGIPYDKLTLKALRATAIRLRLEAGYNLQQIQSFMASRSRPVATRSRLRRLPQLPPDPQAGMERGESGEPAPPLRKIRHFQPGENQVHGFYSRSQPADAVSAVLAENIQGIDEEIAGLRTMARGLLDLQSRVPSRLAVVQLSNAYTKAASRLAAMIEAEKSLAKVRQADAWAGALLQMLDNVARETGSPPVSQAVRLEVLGGESGMELGARHLVEEIAATRYSLRRVLAFAQETHKALEYIRLVDVYSLGCNRLLRLLHFQGTGQERLVTFLREQMARAIREVSQEWGLV